MLSISKSDAPSLIKEHPVESYKPTTKNYFEHFLKGSLADLGQSIFSSHWDGFGMNQRENEDGSLGISINVPGIDAKDLTVEVKDYVVSIYGQSKTNNSDYAISRHFTIPEGYDGDQMTANLHNGVLTLALMAKEMPKTEAKKINITNNPINKNNSLNGNSSDVSYGKDKSVVSKGTQNHQDTKNNSA